MLIGNAAELGVLAPLGHVEPKVFERVMALNAGANYRLIRSFDPLLRAAPAGRAIFVTCSQAQEMRPYWGAYAASKAALEALALSYAAEVRRTRGPGQPRRSRPAAHAAARPRLSRRGPGMPARAGDARSPPFLALAEPACPRHGERLVLQRLGVVVKEVVLGQSAERRLAAERGVGSVVVVAVEPGRHGLGALGRGRIGLPVSPFAQARSG